MAEFLKLNKKKTIFLFKVTSIIFSCFYLTIAGLIAYSNKQLPDITEVLMFIAIFGLVIPLWIFFLGFGAWVYTRKKRKKLFETKPLDKLNELGFNDSLKNEHTKWYFTETIKAGYFSEYFIQVDFNKRNKKIISFKTFIEFQKFDSQKYNRLKKKDINLDLLEISKNYTIKKIKDITIDKLKNDIEEFIEILKKEEFTASKEI